MSLVHESADYTFRLICQNGWADEQLPYTFTYKLSIEEWEEKSFFSEFDGLPGFDGYLMLRVLKEGRYFILERHGYGMWNVDQYATFAERDQKWDRLVKEIDSE